MNFNPDIAGIAALVLALIQLARSLSRNDRSKGRNDVISQLQGLADTTTEKNIVLYRRVMQVESECCSIKSDLRTFVELYDDWCDGIGMLLTQIRKCNKVPVWEPNTEPLQKLKEKYNKERKEEQK